MLKKISKPASIIADQDLNDKLESAHKSLKKKTTKERRAERAQKKRELIMRLKQGDLIQANGHERGIPSDLVRCDLFSVKNRNEKRLMYDLDKPLLIDVVGGGRIKFVGQELRQDDETVWIQLVNVARESRSQSAIFRPHQFLKSINWPTNGPSYDRLLKTIQRLHMASLDLYVDKIDRGMSINLVVDYKYCKKGQDYWEVEVFNKKSNLLFLFDKLYSKLDMDTRLNVSQGVASWLHAFLCSHSNPYFKIDTLAASAGLLIESERDALLTYGEFISLRKQRLREAKRLIIRALDELKEKEFLKDYEIDDNDVVYVTRAHKKKPKII